MAAMPGVIKHFYEFGPFRFDANKHRLMRDGQLVHLSPKAAEALLVLVQNPGKLLEREALMQAVWAESFVEDANLTVAISHLRKALGQNGESAEYIETVPRAGYRFVAEVREVVEEPAPLIIEKRTLSRTVIEEETQPEPSTAIVTLPAAEARPRVRDWRVALAFASFILVVGTGFGIMWRAREKPGASSLASVRSIAVLPLKSFGGNREDEELRLRITDALITRLGGLNGISVRPTDSVLRFANDNAETIEAGKALEVDAVLTGRMQSEGDRLRVTLQLISIQTGAQVWSEQFDGKTNEILNLQDSISAALLPRLARRDNQALALTRNPTANAEAYELYLKGRYIWNRRTPQDVGQAISYFEQAVALDPKFALAYAGLADAYSILANDPILTDTERYAKAREMAKRSLAIDPDLSEAYSALGWISYRYDWNWIEAENAFARAIELNPNNAEAHHWRALNYHAVGKTEEFVAEMEKARSLAPLTKPIAQNYYSVVLEKEGCEKAFDYLEKFHSLHQSSPSLRAELSAMHFDNCGAYERAVNVVEKLPAAERSIKAQAFLGVAYAKSGRLKEAREIVSRLERSASTGKAYMSAYVHVALNNFDAALAHLEQGVAEHDERLIRLKYDDFLTPLRSHPRFKQLLRKMNLPQ